MLVLPSAAATSLAAALRTVCHTWLRVSAMLLLISHMLLLVSLTVSSHISLPLLTCSAFLLPVLRSPAVAGNFIIAVILFYGTAYPVLFSIDLVTLMSTDSVCFPGAGNFFIKFTFTLFQVLGFAGG